VIAGDPNLGFAANFLYTLTGKRPDDVMERAFDVALSLHADHELNASTFAARVTAATLSDIYSSVTSGIGALKGPLHGGANQAVIRWLLDLGDEEEPWRGLPTRWRGKVKIRALAIASIAPRTARDAPARARGELGSGPAMEQAHRLSKRLEET